MASLLNYVKNATETTTKMISTDITEIKQEDADRIRAKHPDRVPVLIVMKEKRVKLQKCKYLVPLDLTMGQLVFVIRKNITELSPSEAIFFFIHEKQMLPPTSALISQIYQDHQKDGFLQLDVALENTFG